MRIIPWEMASKTNTPYLTMLEKVINISAPFLDCVPSSIEFGGNPFSKFCMIMLINNKQMSQQKKKKKGENISSLVTVSV